MVLNQKEKYNYFPWRFAFNLSKSFCMYFISFVSFLNSFFNFIVSKTSIVANMITRIDIKGNVFIAQFFLLPFASFLSCHPSRIGKKKRIMQPKINRATAHSKLFISHSKVNHFIISFLKNPGHKRYVYYQKYRACNHGDNLRFG